MTQGPTFSPREAWRQQIGGIQSRNNLVCKGSKLFIGTCGDTWNVRDRHDGVFCLDRNNGAILWFTPTTADVNEICIAGKSLLAPTDAGDVFVLDADTGNISSIYRADSAVLGKPVVTESVGGWVAIFASIAGSIYLIEEHSQSLSNIGIIDGGLRASLTPLTASNFVASTESGKIVKATIKSRQLQSYEIAAAPVDEVWGGDVAMTAAPLIVGTKLFAGYARSTDSDHPAVFCIDLLTEKLEWVGRSVKERDATFGNVRTTPALVGDKLVVASAYTEGVDILDARTGIFINRVALGQNVFQQWSSPIAMDHNRVAIGRVNGVCSIVNVETAALEASISLATAETERLTRANQGVKYSSDNFALYPGEPAPDGGICGTPLVDRQMLFVGTTDGVIVGVRLDARSAYH